MYFSDDQRKRKAIPPEIKQELFKAQGGKCRYCGRKPGIDLMHVDHKVPFSKGGSDSKRNYQVLCGTCNNRKGDLTDRQFRTRFKAAGVPQTQTIPNKIIPQSAFEAVAKKTATTKAKKATKARTARRNDPFGFSV